MTTRRGTLFALALTLTVGAVGCAPATPGAQEETGTSEQHAPQEHAARAAPSGEEQAGAQQETVPAEFIWQEPDLTLIEDKPLRYVTRNENPDEWEAMRSDWEEMDTEVKLKVPLGLENPAYYLPAYNLPTKGKVELGGMLYFDTRLSADGTVSCSTCHDPAKGFTDQAPVSTGISGQQGGRSAPTVINAVYNASQFWDGRAPSLEAQALGPQTNPIEMGNLDHGQVVRRLRDVPEYQARFRKTFGTDVTVDGIAKAIASFERTVLSGNSLWDQHILAENEGRPDESPFNEPQRRGWDLFRAKAQCNTCHAGFNFTDNVGSADIFHNVGAGYDEETGRFKDAQGNPDVGRFGFVRDTLVGHINVLDTGAYKTPTLRNIGDTAPYLHDGSEEDLAAVVELYEKGGVANPYLDLELTVEPKMPGGVPKKLNLTDQEKADLIAFLEALTGHVVRVPVPPPPGTATAQR